MALEEFTGFYLTTRGLLVASLVQGDSAIFTYSASRFDYDKVIVLLKLKLIFNNSKYEIEKVAYILSI